MNYFILVLSCFVSAMAGCFIGAYVTYKSMKIIVRRKVAQVLKNQNQK
jgi:uncharacterized protein YneF (UPF0154 family)